MANKKLSQLGFLLSADHAIYERILFYCGWVTSNDLPQDIPRWLVNFGRSGADSISFKHIYIFGIQVTVEVLRGDQKEKIPVILEAKPDET